MQAHATDPGVFIRSMATRGHLGGMALAAPEAIRILDASGKDLVIVETVGVGQAEVEVAGATDTTLVVVAPGWGDAVQVAKAGILEIADVFVVNKADRDGVDEAVRDLHQMLRTGRARRLDAAGRAHLDGERRGRGRAVGGDREAPDAPGATGRLEDATAARACSQEVQSMVGGAPPRARRRRAARVRRAAIADALRPRDASDPYGAGPDAPGRSRWPVPLNGTPRIRGRPGCDGLPTMDR